MRQYETIFLISPNLSEEETEEFIRQMEEVVSKRKGKMINKEEWGKRKLAYPIRKFEEAFYVIFHYEGKADIPSELERRFKQTDAIIRFLTVRKEMKENEREKKKEKAPRQEKMPEEEKKQQRTDEEQKENSDEEKGKEE
ncbi:MAG: 30S ribosomal protein S6 [Candidatus Aminicenantes bacterium]